MIDLEIRAVGYVAASVLLLSACGDSGPVALDTARQDTFGFVYSSSQQSSGRGLRVTWDRGPLQIGRVEPFDRDTVLGSGGEVTEMWNGEISPGDTAAAVIGYDGDQKPEPLIVCFSQEEGPPVSCR